MLFSIYFKIVKASFLSDMVLNKMKLIGNIKKGARKKIDINPASNT